MRNAALALLFFLLGCCTAAPSPRSRLLGVKASAMKAGYSADLEALTAAAHEAQAIAAMNPDLAPLAHYWAGYAMWQRAVNDVNLNLDPVADRTAALAEFDAALAARESFADAHALAGWLQGWLYTADPANKDAHAAALRAHITRARELEPDNPRVLWAYATALQFRDRERALAIFDELTRRADVPKPTLDPDWGVPEAMMSLSWSHMNAEKGDLAAAERLARRALELRPGWHYVEQILIPQIEKKKQ